MIARILTVIAIIRALWPLLVQMGKESKDVVKAAKAAASDGEVTWDEMARISEEFGELTDAVGTIIREAVRHYVERISAGVIRF